MKLPQTAPRDFPKGPIPGLLAGALFGALGALAFAGWEAAVLGRVEPAALTGELARAALLVYAATGAILGAGVGLAGLRGGGWALVTVCTGAGWLISGKLGMTFDEAGGAPWMGAVLLVPAALGVSGILASAIRTSGVLYAMATAVFVTLAVAMPVNLHALGSPLGPAALAVDGLVVLAGLVAGGLVWVVIGEARALLPVLLTAGVVGWGLAWPVLAPTPIAWPRAGATDRPPVVLVVVDTLRADHLGLYGYGRPTSPELDVRSRNAIVYDDAAAAASWTLPSAASILTGALPTAHGAGVNDGRGNLRTSIRPDVATLAERLHDSGYVSAAVVTNPWLLSAFGFHRGFDVYDDAVGPAPLPVGLHPLRVLGFDPVGWADFRTADQVTDQALSFVELQTGGGWFLLVHYMDVHGPHVPTDADRDAIGQGGHGALFDAYDASIRLVDRELARLLDGLPEHAWVVLTSDHGEELTEERVLSRPVPRGTRHGHTLYQEQLRVPLVVWGPGVRAGRVSRPVSLLSVAPTLLRVAGVHAELAEPALAEVFGERGQPGAQLAEAIRYGPEQQSARSGRYKLVRHADGRERLYDLVSDPTEQEAIRSSRALFADRAPPLAALLPPLGSGAHGKPVQLEHDVTDLLERLGYVGERIAPGEAAP